MSPFINASLAANSSFCKLIALLLVVITSVSINGIGLDSLRNTLAQQQQQPQTNLPSIEQQQLMEGIPFEIDNVTFSHHMASVNGIQLHYVMGGKGDPEVLLHGYPQSWYEWSNKLCRHWLRIIQ